ncbi:SMI1/KNR4 family protein [Streptomyces sp. NPDC050095]|uniref:SMI1/KNR4 family protein n=1 Tax=unclassified Streptomyces TaxID=2593676 RepID=UPI0034377063
MPLAEAWADIEDWLRHYAPATFASLPNAASHHALHELETRTGGALPPGLRAMLMRHDGSGEFVLPAFHRFSNVTVIRREYAEQRAADERRIQYLLDQHPQHPGQFPRPLPGEHPQRHPRWIPVCHDESGNLLFVTAAEDEEPGRVGVFERGDGASFPKAPAFDSLTSLMEATAQALRSSTFPIWGEWEPYVDDEGFLEWQQP